MRLPVCYTVLALPEYLPYPVLSLYQVDRLPQAKSTQQGCCAVMIQMAWEEASNASFYDA
jgi:hypothetical protein